MLISRRLVSVDHEEGSDVTQLFNSYQKYCTGQTQGKCRTFLAPESLDVTVHAARIAFATKWRLRMRLGMGVAHDEHA